MIGMNKSSIIMTSSDRNIIRVTGHLWGESTGHQLIPLVVEFRAKVSDSIPLKAIEVIIYPWRNANQNMLVGPLITEWVCGLGIEGGGVGGWFTHMVPSNEYILSETGRQIVKSFTFSNWTVSFRVRLRNNYLDIPTLLKTTQAQMKLSSWHNYVTIARSFVLEIGFLTDLFNCPLLTKID